MKLLKGLVVAACTVSGITLFPSAALAVNNTCPNREAMLVGSTENASIAGSSFAFYATRLQAGRSYAILAWTPFQDASEGGGNVALSLFSDAACTTAAAGATSIETREPWSNLGVADIDAIGVIPTVTGEFVLRIQNVEVVAVSHRIIIFETSIYSPWWFTGGNNNSFITLSNRSNSSTSVTVTLNASGGAQCGTTTAVVPANGNTFIHVNTAFAACVAAGFGSAQIAYLSTPGTIQANTTVIDAVGGTSFDEPFVPRMAWSITER